MRALRAIDFCLAPVSFATRLKRRAGLPEAPRILVLEFWRLGDAVMAEPLLRHLRSCFPKAEISLLCKHASRVLLEPSKIVDRFIEIDIPWTAFENKYNWRRYLDPQFIATVRSLRRAKFDVSIDSRMDLRSNLLAWIIGANWRIGFDVAGGRGLLTHRVADPGDKSHKVLDWLAMMEPLGRSSDEAQSPQLHVPGSVRAGVDARLRDLGITPKTVIVGIHPSAGHPLRLWPLDRFAEVVTAIGAIPGVRVLAFVDPDGYGASLESAGATCIRASLEDLPAYLQRCVVFLGNDSGPAHIAAAVGARTVTIFGPGTIDWFRPFGPDQQVVYVDPMPCRPCFDHCIHPTNICLQNLATASVLQMVRQALAATWPTQEARVDEDVASGEIAS